MKPNEKQVLIDALYAIKLCKPEYFKKNLDYKVKGKSLQAMSKLLRLLEEEK